MRRALLAAALLAAATSPQAQQAAEEAWRLVAVEPAPGALPVGTRWVFANGRAEGPAPLACAEARHEFAAGPRSATQRIACAGARFELQHVAPGRATLTLDGRQLSWEREPGASSPTAAVQQLLLAHLASAGFSREGVVALAPWLDPSLQRRLAAWFAQVPPSDEAPALNGDPFTDSQEPPRSITLGSVQRQGDRARLPVQLHFDGGGGRTILYALRRLDGGDWRVIDIAYEGGASLTGLLRQR